MTPEISAPRDASSSIHEFLAVVRLRKWSILALAGVAFLVALPFAFGGTATYRSTAKVLVKPISINAQGFMPGQLQTNMSTEQLVASSQPVAALAAKRLSRRPETPKKGQGGKARQANPKRAGLKLLSHVTVTALPDTQILQFTYSASTATKAYWGARAFSQSYLDFRAEQASEILGRQKGSIERQIDRLLDELSTQQQIAASSSPGTDRRLEAEAQVAVLSSRIAILQNQLGPLSAVSLNPGRVIQPPTRPSSATGPSHLARLALALLIGLVLGVGLAFARERLSDRLRGRGDLEAVLGTPVLAAIPAGKKDEKAWLPTRDAPKSDAAEAYRTLATSVQFAAGQRNVQTLLVTSASDGEGKTAVAANLALALGKAGRRVILIDANLRKPMLHKLLGLKNEKGLAEVLAGAVRATDVLQEVDGTGARVLVAGSVKGHPAEVLGSEQLGAVLADLRDSADLVVLDSSSAKAPEGLALATQADGVLFVADAGSATRGSVTQAKVQLDQVGAVLLGAALVGVDPARDILDLQHRLYPGLQLAPVRMEAPTDGNGATRPEVPEVPRPGRA